MKKENKWFANTTRRVVLRVALLVAVIVTAICAGSVFAAASETYVVDIYDGSQVTRVETSEIEAEKVVAEVGIQLSEKDKLILEYFNPGRDSRIIICRESNVTLIYPNGETHDTLFAGTVAELIDSEGITLFNGAFLNVNLNAVVTNNLEIVLFEAKPITINVDGEKRTVKSVAKTVGDLLKEQNIVLDSDDETNPSLNTELSKDMVVDVLRVEYVSREAKESIPFETETIKSALYSLGTSKVTQKGVEGSKNVVYKDKVVNGQVASSTVISETVIDEPVKQIATVGTFVSTSSLGNGKIEKNGKPISEISLPSKYTIGENNVPTNYKYTISGRAAAYCIPGGITSTGKPAKPGYIAVNPKQIPYGTEMWIVSNDGVVYGYAIAADTGGFVKHGYFTCDLYMNTESQCIQWGDRGVTIYVL